MSSRGERVLEHESHEKLMASNGLYSRLFQMQASSYLPSSTDHKEFRV